jgi:hypothetical protein
MMPLIGQKRVKMSVIKVLLHGYAEGSFSRARASAAI